MRILLRSASLLCAGLRSVGLLSAGLLSAGLLTAGLLSAAGVSAAAQAPATGASAPPASALPVVSVEGRKLFVSYGCYQCHGYEAQGSSATGPRLGPRPLPYAGFSRYVRRPAGQMPPYTERVLADPDLERIYAFVQTRPAPKAVDSIPLLAK